MLKHILIGTILFIILILLKFGVKFILLGNYRNIKTVNIFDHKRFLISAVTFISLISISSWVIESFLYSKSTIIIVSIIFLSLIPTYSFIISPILYQFSNKEYYECEKINNYFNEKKYNYNIRILKGNINNAYATGIIPFSKTILIGEPLLVNLEENELKAILYHEIGHLEKKHLSKLYAINVFLTLVGFCLFFMKINYLDPIYDSVFLEGLGVFLIGLIIGLLFWYIPGKIQYKLEFQADLFASKKVGKKVLISALNRLDDISNGQVSKGGITHPTLIKRIKNLKNQSNEI